MRMSTSEDTTSTMERTEEGGAEQKDTSIAGNTENPGVVKSEGVKPADGVPDQNDTITKEDDSRKKECTEKAEEENAEKGENEIVASKLECNRELDKDKKIEEKKDETTLVLSNDNCSVEPSCSPTENMSEPNKSCRQLLSFNSNRNDIKAVDKPDAIEGLETNGMSEKDICKESVDDVDTAEHENYLMHDHNDNKTNTSVIEVDEDVSFVFNKSNSSDSLDQVNDKDMEKKDSQVEKPKEGEIVDNQADTVMMGQESTTKQLPNIEEVKDKEKVVSKEDSKQGESVESEAPPVKKIRIAKARKSFSNNNRDYKQKNLSQSTLLKTLKLPDIEKRLGITSQGLAKIDAKTFDKLILQRSASNFKALKVKEENKEKTAMKQKDLINNVVLEKTNDKREVEVDGNLNKLNHHSISIEKKKKRKRMGTYKLPGSKKNHKKGKQKNSSTKETNVECSIKSEPSSLINSKDCHNNDASPNKTLNKSVPPENIIPGPSLYDIIKNPSLKANCVLTGTKLPNGAKINGGVAHTAELITAGGQKIQIKISKTKNGETVSSLSDKKEATNKVPKTSKCNLSKKTKMKVASTLPSLLQATGKQKTVADYLQGCKSEEEKIKTIDTHLKTFQGKCESIREDKEKLAEPSQNKTINSQKKIGDANSKQLQPGVSLLQQVLQKPPLIPVLKLTKTLQDISPEPRKRKRKRKYTEDGYQSTSSVGSSPQEHDNAGQLVIRKRKYKHKSYDGGIESQNSPKVSVNSDAQADTSPTDRLAHPSVQKMRQILPKPSASYQVYNMGNVVKAQNSVLSQPGSLLVLPVVPQAQHQSQKAVSLQSRNGLPKYINTPNGISYPVTPPKTPESSNHSGNGIDAEKCPAQAKVDSASDKVFIPLCCCKVNGASLTRKPQVSYCQGLDSIDGKVVGCCNKVTSTQLMRPAVRIPFMALCESHRQRLTKHQCCPGCGLFCSQGKFIQCKEESSDVVHHFHRQCQVYKDNKYYCPHCGEESQQYEIAIRLLQPVGARNFFLKNDESERLYNRSQSEQPRERASSRAKMSMPHRESSQNKKKDEDMEEEEVCLKISDNLKITSDGLPFGPSKKELETVIALLNAEKPKKMRAGPRNIYNAAKNGELERVLFLIMDGLDPNTKDEELDNQTAMHAACKAGHLAIVHVLTMAGASPHATDSNLRTPLMEAAEMGNLSIIRYLMKLGAVVDHKGEDGMTSVHLAAMSGQVDAVAALLNGPKIDINIKDDGGWSPLIWASEHRHVNTVKYLLKHGADPNMHDNEDNTALHWAAYAGSMDIAEHFLNAGCDLHRANEHGDRPLHIASRQGHYECVALFLARGADAQAKNNDNLTPSDCCVEEEGGQVYQALKVNSQLKRLAAERHTSPERLMHRDISFGREANPIPVVNGCDNENYPKDFLYVTENIETSPMNINRVITSLQACQCKDDCASMLCVCSRNSVKCWYDKEGKLLQDFNFFEPPLIFECNKACRCWANCANRVVQLGITCRLQVFKTFGRGWGCRTLLDIPKGTFVCEYIGEHISDAEADGREDDSYLFDLDNKDGDTFCIDARAYGNVARFINHLCEPNLIPVKVFIQHQDLRFPRICFFSSKLIKAGEELGFDYGEKFWIIKYKQFTCDCGSPKCKYSKDTIQKTIEDYNRRQQEEEMADVD